MKILTIVPAHNEEPTLDSCINGIRNQTIETDILVVCDNCTDKTEQLAQSLEVNTLKTINNVHKKSGALNQALDKYLL
ncbi:MAG: glycosyltransferase, partial [Methanothrix sp.]